MTVTNIVSIGFAPNGVEMFSWEEYGVKYTEYWATVPGGGMVQTRTV